MLRQKELMMIRSMSLYIIAVLVANYTATWFIPLPIFGLVSVGTLVFGVTFTQRDRVHRFGRKRVYLMIFIAAVGMVLESLFLGVDWRIIAASFIAIVLSENRRYGSVSKASAAALDAAGDRLQPCQHSSGQHFVQPDRIRRRLQTRNADGDHFR
jgi:hypothetical protein